MTVARDLAGGPAPAGPGVWLVSVWRARLRPCLWASVTAGWACVRKLGWLARRPPCPAACRPPAPASLGRARGSQARRPPWQGGVVICLQAIVCNCCLYRISFGGRDRNAADLPGPPERAGAAARTGVPARVDARTRTREPSRPFSPGELLVERLIRRASW